jgi:hypothetical protein
MEYAGSELELFSHARHWKSYLSRQLKPFIGGRVLEVGAGIGSNIDYLMTANVQDWLSLEPDPKLTEVITERRQAGRLPGRCRVQTGVVNDVAEDGFHSILYIDVLEHIENDRTEVARAAQRLASPRRPVGGSVAGASIFVQPVRRFDRSFPPIQRGGIEGADAPRVPSTTHAAARLRGVLSLAGQSSGLAIRHADAQPNSHVGQRLRQDVQSARSAAGFPCREIHPHGLAEGRPVDVTSMSSFDMLGPTLGARDRRMAEASSKLTPMRLATEVVSSRGGDQNVLF